MYFGPEFTSGKKMIDVCISSALKAHEQCQAIDPSILIGLTALIGRIGDDVKSLIGLAAPCRNGTGGNKNPNAPGRAALPRSPGLFAVNRTYGFACAARAKQPRDQKQYGKRCLVAAPCLAQRAARAQPRCSLCWLRPFGRCPGNRGQSELRPAWAPEAQSCT